MVYGYIVPPHLPREQSLVDDLPFVHFIAEGSDTRVLVGLYDFPGAVCGGVVPNDQFKVGIGLVEYAVNSFTDKFFVVIGSEEYADGWLFFHLKNRHFQSTKFLLGSL